MSANPDGFSGTTVELVQLARSKFKEWLAKERYLGERWRAESHLKMLDMIERRLAAKETKAHAP